MTKKTIDGAGTGQGVAGAVEGERDHENGTVAERQGRAVDNFASDKTAELQLDDALEETFPSSDPLAITLPIVGSDPAPSSDIDSGRAGGAR